MSTQDWTLRFIYECAEDVRLGRSILIIAHGKKRAHDIAMAVCRMLQIADVPCRALPKYREDEDAPSIMTRSYLESPAERKTPAWLSVHVDPAAVRERIGRFLPPRVRSVAT